MGGAVKKIGAIAAAPLTGGASLLAGGSGMSDFLLGKKDRGTPGQYVALDPSLAKNVEIGRKNQLGQFRQALWSRTAGQAKREAKEAAQANIRAARGAFDDTQNRLGSLIAQRGLGKSSVGLSQILGAAKERDFAINQARAGEKLMADRLKRQFADERFGLSNQMLANPGRERTYIQGREATGQRQGGLLKPLLGIGGAVAGGMFGGGSPQAIGAGASAGSGLGSIFQGAF